MLEAESATAGDIASYDTLVIGSPVYIGKLLIKSWLKRYSKAFGDKTLLFFIVCGTPASEREQQVAFAQNNIPHDLIGPANVFFLPGRLSIEKLSLRDRLMLWMGTRLEKDPVKKAAMHNDNDGVKRELLVPIIQQIQVSAPAI
jgi:menaquinone-dependent protoporphyrinogen IX oxidase